MPSVPDLTNWFFAWLWRTSWQASIIVLLVLGTQWLLGDRLRPRWRHALWALVVIRLALPWSVPTPFSVFNWVFSPASSLRPPPSDYPSISAMDTDEQMVSGSVASLAHARSYSSEVVHGLWLAGALSLPVYLLMANYRFGSKIRRQRPVTNSAVLDLLEDCKQSMEVRTPVTLVETPLVSSPSLFGFIRPRLLLPSGLTQRFSLPELRYVFLHELSHIKRADIPITWLMTLALVFHWFNPILWYALSRMRMDRELACDALALAQTREAENRAYGHTIIKLLEHFHRPALAPGLVGILENKNQMKRRISMIATFKKNTNWPVLAATVCAGLAMVTLTDAQSGQGEKTTREAGAPDSHGLPRIIATSPKVGETEVKPDITEITVTFDRDMQPGFSWTGGPPDFPPGPEGQKARWRDKRTCVLPVRVEAARYYRVGINSTSYQNFRSVDGVPAQPSAIYFTTLGASEQLKRKASRPVIVGLVPKNGAADVDPNLKEIRVTFSVSMGDGFSWTGGGEQFPTIPEGKKPFWTDDHKTCVLPVELKPGWEYHLGLNSPSHKNFQSSGGVPLDPVSYTFKTKTPGT